MFDAIGQLFQGLIDFLEPILIPDWRALLDLLPLLLLIGVVGPLLSLLVLGWFIYFVGKPRSRIPYQPPAPQPAAARRGRSRSTRRASRTAPSTGSSIPSARPAARRASRDLAVICPKCGTGRQAFDRHLRHVRARPQDRPRRARASARRARRPEAPRRPDRSRNQPARLSGVRRIAWKFLTQALFAIGTVVLAFAFAATVGHAVMLANGRRHSRRR